MAPQTKVIKVPASSTRNFLIRSIFTPSMEKTIEKWANKGWKHIDTTPVTGARGKTTHYLLTFEKK